MDGREENLNETSITKKSRSLDVKSLSKSQLTKESVKKKSSKRDHSRDGGDDEKMNKRKKVRKEVSSSILDNVDGRIEKTLDGEPSSSRQDLGELKFGLSSGSQTGGVFICLRDNLVHVPTRKRSVRKKIEDCEAANRNGLPNCENGSGDQVPNLGRDGMRKEVASSKIKQKKNSDEFKETMSSNLNSVHCFKGNEYLSSHPLVNSSVSSLKKLGKNDRKRKTLALDRSGVAKEAEPLIGSCKLYDDLQQDDDEENLLDNAALMLSSRFDPSCTGFDSSSKSSGLASENGLFFCLPSSENVVNHGSKSQLDSESALVDTADKNLLPKKRRHFYDIPLGDVDAYCLLKRRIKVFWPLDQSWYYGFVNNYDEEKKLYHIKYDDRDEEWINLQTERFKLLLLRSEFPGNLKHRRSSTKGRSSDQQDGSMSRNKRQTQATIVDDSCGGSGIESEPIISWLARSPRQVKSSSFHGNTKQKCKVVGATRHLAKDSLVNAKKNLSYNPVSQDKSEKLRKKSHLQRATHTKDGKQHLVYYRKKFQSAAPIPVANKPSLRRVEIEGPLCFTYKAEVSKLFWDIESSTFRFDLKFPILSVLNCCFELESLWLLGAGLLHNYGTVVTKWPIVDLEILFVDNVVGLRFVLFKGCLNMVVAFIFFVLRFFHQFDPKGSSVDLQWPLTSIGFKLSNVHLTKKPLVFAFYSFSKVKNSKWISLDSKLKKHCILCKQLPLAECTYDNIHALQSGSHHFPMTSISDPTPVKLLKEQGRQKRSRHGIYMGGSKVSTQLKHQSMDAIKRKFPPFSLSFVAAPAFFLSLHLNMLMKQSEVHLNFCDHAPIDVQKDFGLVEDNYPSINLKNNMMTLSEGASVDEQCCAELDQVIGSTTCSDQIVSENFKFTDFSGAITSIAHGSKRHGIISEWQSHPSQLDLSSSVQKDKVVDGSHFCNLSVQIPQFEKSVNGDLCVVQNSLDFSRNIDRGVIPRSNLTAPRSSWHRKRSNSLLSPGWSVGKAKSFYSEFSVGPRKPRRQVSYSVPFAGYNFSSRYKSHHQKVLSHKRNTKASEKKSLDVARVPEKNFESLSCVANVLITDGDKGWRESGSQVVLELVDHNEWKLAVKILGNTTYSYKANQALQPGSINRYSHAMTWKGGKDWTLEFPDRSQWALFKVLYEECYIRNIRAASVKNIPIPGVHLKEENDDNGHEVTYVRSCNYFRQVETDFEMALDPLRILYDMDSEDEQWISNIQNIEKDNCDLNGISEEMFEKTMDLFEKAAYSQKRDGFTPNELEELMVNVGPLCLVKVIYDHWQKKRQKKGMALIRHFQPPLWQRYQKQVEEWEVALSKNNNPSNGGVNEVATLEKPPMFAFCLKPRGLKLLNKGLKHRSQKRVSLSRHTNSNLYQDGFHTFGRRLSGFAVGDENFKYPNLNYDSLDDSSLRVFSPNDADMRYYSKSNDGNYRNHVPKVRRGNSNKFSPYIYHNDSQFKASYSQRMSASGKQNGFNRQHLLDGPQRYDLEGSELEELKLRSASNAAKHARNRAKFMRQRAIVMQSIADATIQRAAVALMTAEAIKASKNLVESPLMTAKALKASENLVESPLMTAEASKTYEDLVESPLMIAEAMKTSEDLVESPLVTAEPMKASEHLVVLALKASERQEDGK